KSSASSPSRTTSMILVRLFSFRACSVSSTSFGLSSTSKISMVCVMVRSFQGEKECRALIDVGFRPNASSVPMNNTLNDGQPDAGALVFFGAVQALENAEKFIGIFHVKADPVIPHVIDGRAVVVVAADLDERCLTTTGILQCIRNQIDVNLLE